MIGRYGVETDDNGSYHARTGRYDTKIQRVVYEDPIGDELNLVC